MNKAIRQWQEQSKYDYDTARAMMEAKRYIYAIFMCHLAIEKVFKALVTYEQKKLPPKTHDLIKLLTLAKLNLSDDLRDFIGMLNNVAIITRYPEDLKKIQASYNRTVVKKYLLKTNQVMVCVLNDPRLKKS